MTPCSTVDPMKRIATAFLLVLCAAPLGFGAPTMSFRIVHLATDQNEGCAVADLNRDGVLDIVAGRNWYPGPDYVARPLRSIDDWNGYVESNGDHVYDVNGDGWPDVVSGSFIPMTVHWFQNPGEEGLKFGSLWKKHLLVDTRATQNEGTFLRDMDGDGVPEWITNSWNAKNEVRVWKFTSQEGVPSLIAHVIGADGQAHGMGFGDVNNDGREDVLTGRGWYERPEGEPYAAPWKFHADWNAPGGSLPMLVRDLNGDGINDVIWGKGHDYGLYWWQGTGIVDGKFTFKEHLIDREWSQPHAMILADITGDGREELITGKRFRAHNGKDPGGKEPPGLYYYTWDKSTLTFTRHTIDFGRVGTGLQINVADLDQDGRLDIIVAGKSGTYILFNQGHQPKENP